MSVFESLPIEQRDAMLRHLELVIEANEKVNLTRIVDEEEARLLHIEDSLLALPEIESCPDGFLGDLGSGGGFPGIPIAIATGRETMLIDSRKKKMEAMAAIIETMGMSGSITTFPGRAELLARKMPEHFSVLTARALAKLSVLQELACPLLRKGGRLVCYKAQLSQEEIDNSLRVQKSTGMKLVSDRDAILQEGYVRRILVYEKVARPTIKLPRQEGEAQRNPL